MADAGPLNGATKRRDTNGQQVEGKRAITMEMVLLSFPRLMK
jgi:hypothetical protein